MVQLPVGANNSADFNSMSNNVSTNAMIRQVANGISSQSNYLEAALGGRSSGLDEASGEYLYQNNDNAAVELSPAMENPRIDRGSVGDCLYISSTSAEDKEDEEDIFVCKLCHSKHSPRCVDRTYPFLTNDPRDSLEIMEECDNTYGIPSQYCFFNIEELKQHTEMHHLDPLLNESNANLLEGLYDYDDDDNVRFVRTMTPTTKHKTVCRNTRTRDLYLSISMLYVDSRYLTEREEREERGDLTPTTYIL
jgi:hypothetical protein